MPEQDLIYYQRREQSERLRAEQAADQAARCAHLAMAERYAERLRRLAPAMPQPA